MFKSLAASISTLTTILGTGASTPFSDGVATSSTLNFPTGVWGDSSGKYLYVADYSNHRVRKLNMQVTPFTVATFVGTGTASNSGDGGAANVATINGPISVWGDMIGNIYITSHIGHTVRIVSPDGIISTIAGNGEAGYNGENISPAIGAKLNKPYGLVGDNNGKLYFSEFENHRIRQLTNIAQTATPTGK